MSSRRSFRLMVTFAFCLLMVVPLLLVWLVNLDVALRAVNSQLAGLSSLGPQWFTDWAKSLALDFSTVSTMVPLLIFLFPMIMSLRIMAKQTHNPEYVHSLQWDPYPPQFPFFLVMLGLTGTLYGLFIGLGVSGVAELGEATADTIRETIDRLLDGTATALLSSLFGLIGAFLAARPLTWIFRRVAGVPAAEDHQPISETLAVLNRDLGELAHASRKFSESLRGFALDDIAEEIRAGSGHLTKLREDIGSIDNRMASLVDLDEKIVGQLETLSALDNLAELSRLQAIENAQAKAGDSMAAIRSDLAESSVRNRELADKLIGLADRGCGELNGMSADLKKISAALSEVRSRTGEERDALKNALMKYLSALEEKSA